MALRVCLQDVPQLAQQLLLTVEVVLEIPELRHVRGGGAIAAGEGGAAGLGRPAAPNP